MEFGAWDLIKSTIQWFVLPAIAALAFFFRKYIHRIDKMEDQVREIEVRTAVVESKIDDIRDDLKEIKRGVEKLIERRQQERK